MLYSVPFILALAMLGWRSLLFLSAAGIGFYWYGSENPGDGAGSGFFLAFLLVFAVGLSSGVATRALILLTGGWRKPLRSVPIAMFGFLLPIAIFKYLEYMHGA